MRTNSDGGPPEMSAKIMSHPIVSQKQQPMGQTSDDAALLHHGTSTNGMVPMSLFLYQYYALFLLPPSLASQRCQLPVACNTSTPAYTREIGNILVYTFSMIFQGPRSPDSLRHEICTKQRNVRTG